MATLYGLARLGRDAEIRFTPNGDAVANLSLAFSYGKKGSDGNRPTQWVDGSLWGKRAEAMAPYLNKGGLIMVTLEDVHIETFESKNGPGHKLAGKVANIEFAGGAQTAQPQKSTQPQQSHTPPSVPQGGGGMDFGDDIPFSRVGAEHYV